jgi:RNA polymerase sigma-70 factor, ECF subfamily
MDRENASDEELMLGFRDGDAAAFDALYGRHKGGLYRYLLRQCRIAAVAEELYQDVWMNLIRARDRYTVEARFTTWLYRLAHNRLVDHYRRNSRHALISFEDDDCPDAEAIAADGALEPEAHYDVKQRVARFLALLEQLPEAQREAFLLHEEAGMDLEEISAVTGVSRETAKSRLRYALAKLKAGMQSW